MIFVTGPLYAGKKTYIRKQFGLTEKELAELAVWDIQKLAGTEEPDKLAERLSRHAVVIATEVGSGVVPVDPEERKRREAAGRLACCLAERAQCVIRVCCGLPQVLKGELPDRPDAGKPMQILLIRHGKTPLGEKQQYQGVLDTALSDGGRAALQKAECTPERVYVSPLKRAEQTAAILFPEKSQTVVTGLSEMNFGEFEGRSWKEMEHDAAYREWVDGNCEGKCPGGEDRSSFSERVCGAFRELVDQALRDDLKQIAVVAHGGTQMAVLERWAGSEKAYWEWQTECGCGWVLDTSCWPEALNVTGSVRYIS